VGRTAPTSLKRLVRTGGIPALRAKSRVRAARQIANRRIQPALNPARELAYDIISRSLRGQGHDGRKPQMNVSVSIDVRQPLPPANWAGRIARQFSSRYMAFNMSEFY
jgi:hypothetical protein